MTDYKKPNYKIDAYWKDGKHYGSLLLANDARYGIVNVTHELAITILISKKNAVTFESAWEIGCGGDWDYSRDEAALFEQDHPGLLKDIEEAIRDGRTSL